MENKDLARIFSEIADILEIQEANPFRIRSFRRAAQIIRDLTFNGAQASRKTPKGCKRSQASVKARSRKSRRLPRPVQARNMRISRPRFLLHFSPYWSYRTWVRKRSACFGRPWISAPSMNWKRRREKRNCALCRAWARRARPRFLRPLKIIVSSRAAFSWMMASKSARVDGLPQIQGQAQANFSGRQREAQT